MGEWKKEEEYIDSIKWKNTEKINICMDGATMKLNPLIH